MVCDWDYREAACAAIDTAYALSAQGADTPGAFVVPTTASRITDIRIGLGGIAVDTVADVACSVHLHGAGVQLGEGRFAGPVMGVSGAAATSGGFAVGQLMKYKTNIPVKPGAQFNADAFVYGTDSGTAHMFLQIGYDGIPGRIVDGDIREVALTTANTLVTVNARETGAAGDFQPVSTIGEVIVGFAPTPTGHATDGLNAAMTAHLSGAGLLHAGNYKYVGNVGVMQPDTDVSGSGITHALPERYEGVIPIKIGSTIRAQAQVIESTQAGNAIVGLCYI